MHKKYFFFDIDGTLLYNKGQDMAEHTLSCLNELRAKGHFVAIASGRLQQDTARMAKRFDITSFIADGGNSLTYEGKLLQIEPLPYNKCLELLEALDRQKVVWGTIPRNTIERFSPYPALLEACRGSYMQNIIDPGYDFHRESQFMKLFICCTREEQAAIHFPNDLPLVRFSPQGIYVEPDDKAKGIRAMMNYLNAPLEDVVVFGDGTNDLKMFDPENWTRIAMGNAKEVLKERADFITTNVEEDGIYQACRHFGWVD